jgi:hypothetical protein
MARFSDYARLFAVSTTVVAISVLTGGATRRSELMNADLGCGQPMFGRMAIAASTKRSPSPSAAVGAMTPAERRAAIDAYWGAGSPTAEFPVDELVWLTPADVAAGRDTVVNAALAWLHTQLH